MLRYDKVQDEVETVRLHGNANCLLHCQQAFGLVHASPRTCLCSPTSVHRLSGASIRYWSRGPTFFAASAASLDWSSTYLSMALAAKLLAEAQSAARQPFATHDGFYVFLRASCARFGFEHSSRSGYERKSLLVSTAVVVHLASQQRSMISRFLRKLICFVEVSLSMISVGSSSFRESCKARTHWAICSDISARNWATRGINLKALSAC